MNFLLIAIGGATGALTRYGIYEWSARTLGTAFPYATFIVNVVGSFVIGILAVWLASRLAFAAELRALLIVGFLGAFTTFSSFSIDTITLFRDTPWLGALNILLNVGVCLLAVYIGMLLASK